MENTGLTPRERAGGWLFVLLWTAIIFGVGFAFVDYHDPVRFKRIMLAMLTSAWCMGAFGAAWRSHGVRAALTSISTEIVAMYALIAFLIGNWEASGVHIHHDIEVYYFIALPVNPVAWPFYLLAYWRYRGAAREHLWRCRLAACALCALGVFVSRGQFACL